MNEISEKKSSDNISSGSAILVVFNGSPRAEQSNTKILVDWFLEGAKEAGAEAEVIFLSKCEIKDCLGCFGCWTRTPGRCLQKDDMQALLSKMLSADIVVFATPVYVDSVSGLMKRFLDRCIPILDPYFEVDATGEYRHRSRYEKYPRIVVISNCGFPEQSHFQVISHMFERIARNFHSKVIGEIYRGGGELLQEKGLFVKLLTKRYKGIVKQAGFEVVKYGRIKEDTKVKLEKPLVNAERYVKGAYSRWDKSI